jgi:hypothetical protein
MGLMINDSCRQIASENAGDTRHLAEYGGLRFQFLNYAHTFVQTCWAGNAMNICSPMALWPLDDHPNDVSIPA